MAKALKQTGVTSDGKPVVSFFPLVDTHGLPLSMAVQQLVDRGVMPDWTNFYLEALRHGSSESNTYTQLENAVVDSLGSTFAEGWRPRMALVRAMFSSTAMPRLLLPPETLAAYRAGTLPLEDAARCVVDKATGEPVSFPVAAYMLECAP